MLTVMPVLIALLVVDRFGDSKDGITSELSDLAIAPAPASGPPIVGEQVELRAALERSPYSVPLPASANLQVPEEVWVSPEHIEPAFHQVYLIYPNRLRISIGGNPEPLNLHLRSAPFRSATVREHVASGKDTRLKTVSDGRQTNVPASLTWGVNQIRISLYHPTWTMDELLKVARSMDDPVWTKGS